MVNGLHLMENGTREHILIVSSKALFAPSKHARLIIKFNFIYLFNFHVRKFIMHAWSYNNQAMFNILWKKLAFPLIGIWQRLPIAIIVGSNNALAITVA